MGRWGRMAALGALVTLLAGCAMQATGRAPRHTGMGRAPTVLDVSQLGTHEIEGRLLSIDTTRGVVEIQQEDGIVRLQAAADTAVFVEGGVGGIADLREGAPVRASFAEDGSSRIAHWIEIPRAEPDQERDTGIEPAGQEVAR